MAKNTKSASTNQKYGDRQDSPTKVSEARAKKNADLKSANTKTKGTANTAEQERTTIPVNQRPEDRLR